MLNVSLDLDSTNIIMTIAIDPPGPSRISGHYFHAWCLYVRLFVRLKNKNTLQLYMERVTKFAILVLNLVLKRRRNAK